MTFPLRIHYDNLEGFAQPQLHLWTRTGAAQDFALTGHDAYGAVYDVRVASRECGFVFRDGATQHWESPGHDRQYASILAEGPTLDPPEIWVTARNAFVYDVAPAPLESQTAEDFLRTLPQRAAAFVADTGGRSGLGTTLLADGRTLFGYYHPNAARVYVVGTFNDWQGPAHEKPDATRFLELQRYRGYFDAPNTWLLATDQAKPGDEYKFFVRGGVARDGTRRFQQYVTDPYARRLGADTRVNNGVIVDPTRFEWHDAAWVTPDPDRLTVYELSVHGFTEGDRDVGGGRRGRFTGITERIRERYFDQLGVTALSLMPLAEVPTPQGPTALGYNPSLFFTVERDFGSPNDLRRLVDAAHQHGLAVLLDQVFNHTDNGWNPLWGMILEHPGDEFGGGRPLLRRRHALGQPGGHREARRPEHADRRLQALPRRVPRGRIPV